LSVTTAGLSEEKKTGWPLFFKLSKQEAVRIEPAQLRHRPAPKEGTQSYLWVMACEEMWVELYDKSHGCALLPTAPNLRAVYIQAVQCDTSDMTIASKFLHLGIVPSESQKRKQRCREAVLVFEQQKRQSRRAQLERQHHVQRARRLPR